MDFAFQNSFYQPYSPYQFKVPPSPYNQMESNCYLESELPFENFPLQRMFELGNDSHPQSPALKKIVVIKPAQTKQEQDFKLVQVDTNNMTPAKRTNYSRRYYSERLEKKFNRYSLFTDTKEVEVQPPRSQKGLRNLSLKVKDIVIELKSTTYKDVAERLIQELAQENKQIDQDNGYRQHLQESKDEQNIKRRVYDALNVMIASGVLRKEGKKVLSDVYFNQKGKIKRSEREQRKEELIKLRRIVTEKRKRLSELYTKILCLHNLIERNKSIQIENSFDFPILIFQENKNSMKIIMDKKILKILSHRKLLITGDLDILVQMEMYKKNPELIKQMQVSPEIQDFLVGQIAQFCHRHQ